MTISERLIENAITRIEYGSEEFMQDSLLIEQSKEVGVSMADLWYITQYIRYVYRPAIECKTRDKCCTELVERIKELQKQLEASETQNKRVFEKLELITKSNQELEKQLEEKEKYTYTGKGVGEIERKYESQLEDLRNIKTRELADEVFNCATQLAEKEKELREIRVENYTIKSYRDFLNNKCKNLIKENKMLKQQLTAQPAEIVEKIKRTVVPVARLTKNNEMRIELNSFFRVLGSILQEYQKREN